MKDEVARYQLESDDVIIDFRKESDVIHFIQHELDQDTEYEVRTLH